MKLENYEVHLPSYSIGNAIYDKIGPVCESYGKTVLVIGGKLTFLPTATVEGGDNLFGGADITPAANLPASDATTIAALKDDFNALLSALKAVGLMEADGQQ